MPTDNALSKKAYGTINPMRFVQDAPGIVNGALQCSGAGVPIIGIAVEATTNIMGTAWQPAQGYPAAASGDNLRIYGENGPETMLVVGSGQIIVPNQLLTSDASGNGVGLNIATASSGVHWVGAKAIEGGEGGNPIRVIPLMFPYTKP